MRSDVLRPGELFPDYELPDQDGILQRLSALQDNDPMVLVLSRGSYCPKDQLQHRDLVRLAPALSVSYTSLVTIATDPIETLRDWRAELGAPWPFLSDTARRIQRDLGIQEYTDPYYDPMIPYTLVLLPGLKIHKVYNGYWFWGRPSNEELHRDLREASRLCRPDWDITTPELRKNWASDRRLHYPYERSTVLE